MKVHGRLLDTCVDADGHKITKEALQEAVRNFSLPAKVRWEFQPSSIGEIKSIEAVVDNEGTLLYLNATIELEEEENGKS